MSKNQAIEYIATMLDNFNGSKMMVENEVLEGKSNEFGTIIVKACKVGFKPIFPKNKVMELLYDNQEEVMVSIDCDDEKAIIDTTRLWKFIEQQKTILV